METITNENQPADIAESILGEIRDKKLTMRPRIYFILKMAALLSVVFAVLAISVFLFGFIFWSVAASGQALLLGFGASGFEFFFLAFPWGWLFIDVLLLALGKKLISNFSFGYRIPALYLMIALVAGSVSIGVLLEDLTHLNDFLSNRAMHNELPLFGGFYKGAARPEPNDGICRCVVIKVGTSTLLVRDEWDTATDTVRETVMLFSATDTSAYKVGDRVFIFGTEGNGQMRPEGMEKLPPLSTSTAAYSY